MIKLLYFVIGALIKMAYADQGYNTNYDVERYYDEFNLIHWVFQVSSPGSRTPPLPLGLDADETTDANKLTPYGVRQ